MPLAIDDVFCGTLGEAMDDAQRTVAQDLLGAIGTAVGGAGALWALKEVLQRVFASGSRNDD